MLRKHTRKIVNSNRNRHFYYVCALSGRIVIAKIGIMFRHLHICIIVDTRYRKLIFASSKKFQLIVLLAIAFLLIKVSQVTITPTEL